MELSNYYSLDECSDVKFIKKRLNKLQDDGKIDYEIDGYLLKIIDEDMDLEDIEALHRVFEKFDIYPYNYDGEEDQEDYYGYEEEDDY